MEINVNGIRLYYEVVGEGSPLIMVHGNGEDHTIFYEASEVLKKYFTVYLVDSRGHGKSEKVSEFHYQDMADDMKEFIKKLNLTDVTYYGFSDGGIIGILLASQTNLCKRYIVSGVNTQPGEIKLWLKLSIKGMYLFKKDPLMELMMKEPHISDLELEKIHDEFILLAGSKDLILKRHTQHLHEVIAHSKMEIINGEDHGSYIVHNKDIAYFILKYCMIENKME